MTPEEMQSSSASMSGASTATSSPTESNPPPSEAYMQLLSSDGYYTYFSISKPPFTEEFFLGGAPIDEDLIKRTYRKLSLKHHPDRPTGDADTFRLLNRAQKVLLNQKLRQQYDLLGIDLEDDEEESSTPAAEESDGSTPSSEHQPSSPEAVLKQVASFAIASVFLVIMRTLAMAVVVLLLVRFRWTLYLTILFTIVFAYRMHSSGLPTHSVDNTLSPLMVCFGLILMHRGQDNNNDMPWSWTFWIGEMLVMTMFAYHSISVVNARTPAVGMITFIVSAILALLLRGKLWNYVTLLVMEGFVLLVVAAGFPLMEMLLERILGAKLLLLGDKIREHNEKLHKYYTLTKR